MLANATTIEKDDFSDLFSGQIGDENFDFDISNMDDSLNLSIDNENIESQDDLPEVQETVFCFSYYTIVYLSNRDDDGHG